MEIAIVEIPNVEILNVEVRVLKIAWWRFP